MRGIPVPIPVLSMVGLGLIACGSRALAPADSQVEDSRQQRDAAFHATSRLCTQNEDCTVVNNCCDCLAIDRWTVPERCVTPPCVSLVCSTFGFVAPKAVCIEGHCHLAEGNPDHCQSVDDCVVYQDCCYCMAVPKTVKPGKCPGDCVHDACAASGLGLVNGKAQSTCFKGECKLTSTD